MPQQRDIEIQWPIKGLNRRAALQKQPPYSTPDCNNVWPDDAIAGEERTRGGSRPGLGKKFSEELGSGNPIRLLHSVKVVDPDQTDTWSDDFNGVALSSAWSAANGLTIPTVSGGEVVAPAGSTYGAVRGELANLDDTKEFTITLLVNLKKVTSFYGETYNIFARLDDSSPDQLEESIHARMLVSWPAGMVTGVIEIYHNGTGQATYAFTASPTVEAGGLYEFSLIVNVGDSADRVKPVLNGPGVNNVTLRATTDVSGHNVAAGTGMGFSLGSPVLETNVDRFVIAYTETDDSESLRDYLIASANGSVYAADDVTKEFDVSGTSLTLRDDELLCAASFQQKVYIADHGDLRAAATDGVVSSSTTFDSATYSDWTAIGINANDFVVNITDGGTGATEGIYKISSIASGDITLASLPGNATGITFRIERAAKIYDPVADDLSIWTPNQGLIPTGYRLVSRWLGRLVLAGKNTDPHFWVLSRRGNPLDFNLGADAFDVNRAIASSNADAGAIGEPITALVPYDDYHVFGCTSSIWSMIGDPAQNGRLVEATSAIGIMDKMAFAKGPKRELYLLGHDGMYLMIGPAGNLESISREVLPAELRDLDVASNFVMMAYSTRHRGVFIFVTNKESGGGNTHWWFDGETGGFWPMSFSGDHEPTAALAYDPTVASDAVVLFGGRDGYVRALRPGNPDDDDTAISSHVLLGPFMPGSLTHEGAIMMMFATLAGGSGTVTWQTFSGKSAEEAYAAATATTLVPKSTGTWRAGRSGHTYPRTRGQAIFVRLSSTSTWALESMVARITKQGIVRVA